MFKRGRSKRVTDEIRAVSETFRFATGNIVIFRHEGTTVGVRLDDPQAYGVAPGVEHRYGPADQIGNALADILKHITGTPPDAPVEHNPEDTDEFRHVPEPMPTGLARQAIEQTAQADVLAYLSGHVDQWRGEESGSAGTRALLEATARKVADGNYIQGPPF